MTNTIRTKEDVQLRYNGGRHTPTVNVKVYGWPEHVSLPLILGVSAPADDPTNTTTHYTHEGFTHEWIEEHLSDRDRETWWQMACESGWESLQEDADYVFGDDYTVKVYSEGRSGGWCIVEGLPDIESWDAIMLGKWRRFAKYADGIVAYVPESYIMSIYMNVYEPWHDEQTAEANEDAASHLPIKTNE